MATILIVDDEASFVRSLTMGLVSQNAGYQILSASDGHQAMEQLANSWVDLVLTDLEMPKMNGYKLVTFVRRCLPFVPIILMTAYGTPELERNYRRLGIQHYLEKPVDLDEVAACVATALAGLRNFGSSRRTGA